MGVALAVAVPLQKLPKRSKAAEVVVAADLFPC
jgi:hypothetical protein